jgi:hypothetical protein
VMISFNTEKQACQGELIQLLFRPQKHYKRAVACMGPSKIAFLGKTTVLIEPIATLAGVSYGRMKNSAYKWLVTMTLVSYLFLVLQSHKIEYTKSTMNTSMKLQRTLHSNTSSVVITLWVSHKVSDHHFHHE